MHKIITPLLIVISSITLSAKAQDNDEGWFVDVLAGPTWVDTETFESARGQDVLQVKSATGLSVVPQIGYDFGWFRLGTEFAYQTASSKRGVVLPGFFMNPENDNSELVFPTLDLQERTGKRSSLSYMVNATFDTPSYAGWSAYVGGGLGGATVRLENVRFGSTQLIDDKDVVLAWQGFIGVRKKLSDRFALSTQLRYFDTRAADYRDNFGLQENGQFGAGRLTTGDFSTFSLLFGLSYDFGGRQ